jgi:hypothetical protein
MARCMARLNLEWLQFAQQGAYAGKSGTRQKKRKSAPLVYMPSIYGARVRRPLWTSNQLRTFQPTAQCAEEAEHTPRQSVIPAAALPAITEFVNSAALCAAPERVRWKSSIQSKLR